MRKLIGVALLAGLMCLPAGVGWGQRTVGRDTGRDAGRDTGRGASSGVINYSDLSSRQTRRTDREDRQKKEAEEAKKKAEEQRREKERADRMKRWQDERGQRPGGSTTASSNNRQTTGSRTAGNNPNGRGKSATAPVTTGGSYDPTTREVTEVMLDAIKTRHVQFDPEEARENPSMILLNAPRSDPNQRRRATDTGIARPL